MLQRQAEMTLMELTQGLVDQKPQTRTAQRKRIAVAAAKAAGFVEAGSGLYMAVDNKELDTKEGQFWEVKGDVNGQPYLERMSYDVDQDVEKKEEADVEVPHTFSTVDELYEWFNDHGGRVNQVDTRSFEATLNGQSVVYEDQNSKVVRTGSDHEEELQRRASNGNEPPVRTLPEGVEMDVLNKYDEAAETRELSLSERSDVSEIKEDIDEKGLDPLTFD